jgi:phosphoribosylanthranilate isomerase
MKIKLCGIRRKEDIAYVNEFMPDYIGFVFAASKRQVSPEFASKLHEELSPEIKTAGVFVNSSPHDTALAAKTAGLDIIQLHGDEDRDYVLELKTLTDCEIWKAVRVRTQQDIINGENSGADKLLLDSFSPSQYGGTGKTADFDVIKNTSIKIPFFLAGGLNAGNIADALKYVMPFGADVSGGIETDGFKDRKKIKEIINIVRSTNFEQ